ncbi:MAG: bifunctional diguanylate cyclase/phosphodiesterase [Methylophaga sp.]|nr:MAG: bifunctional diguanylate cyclase/phosphodiesterase [Methylophaga sp.]
MFFMNHQHVLSDSVLEQTYSIPLVVLSVFIAIVSSFTAFGVAERIYASSQKAYKIAWTLFGALTMGFGIWAMHFIGMLALSLPVPVVYDVTTTLISVIPAIAASVVVLWMMAKPLYTRINLLRDGLLLGSGIGLMHHLGMSAMRMDATLYHDPFLFYLSLIGAVVIATIALRIKHQATNQQQYTFISKAQILSAIVMGFATSSMHYTAMLAVDFSPIESSGIVIGISSDTLTIMVSIVAFMIITLAILLPLLLRYKQTVVELDRLVEQEKADKARINAIVDSAFDALVRCNAKGEIIGWSVRAEEMFGWSASEAKGEFVHKLIIPERYRGVHRKGLAHFLETKKSTILNSVIEIEALHRQGHEFPIELTVSALKIKGGYEFNAFIRDISERKKAQAEQYLLAKVFSDTHEGIIITDIEGIIVDVNPTFTSITGYSREEAIGKNPNMLSSGKHDAAFYKEMWKSIIDNGHWQGEIWNRNKNGELFAEMITISALKDNNITTHYVCLFSDITKSKQQQNALEQMAHYDVLTKLPNRTLFADRFAQAIAHSNRNNTLLAVCFLDLDSFKPINDEYGHDIGDQLLIEVAERISSSVRVEDTVSRQGGDEFAILLGDIESFLHCEQLLERLHHILARPYVINGYPHKITASIGVTLYPIDDENRDTLMRHADQAMYQAKLAGRNRFHLFNALDDLQIIQRQHQLDEIRHALSSNELCLYYQPKVNMKTGKILGVEALIRWQHPEKGLIPPLDFLPYIDGTDLEVELGGWIINTALSQLDLWQKQGVHLQVSVNVSSYHLLSPVFFDQVNDALTLHPAIDSQDLQLEILESSVLKDITAISKIIKSCQNDLGVEVALDDFGTGYSSLTHIRNLSANTIKIDQSFVRDLLDDPSDYSIIEGVIGLAQAFNRNIIAEGVENEAVGIMLLIMGCDNAQGDGIAWPLPAEDIVPWIESYTPNLRWIAYGGSQLTLQEQKTTLLKLTTEHWFNNMKKVLRTENRNLGSYLSRCHLGIWIDRLRKDHVFDDRWIAQLQRSHDRMYKQAQILLEKHQSEGVDAAKKGLNKFTKSFEEVKDILERKM